MNWSDLIPIAPLLIVSLTVLLLLAHICWRRSRLMGAAITTAGLVTAMMVNWFYYPEATLQVTQLLAADPVSALFNLLILVSAISVTLFHHQYSERYDEVQEEFYLLLLLATVGALVLVSATHVATLVLGLELLSLSSIAMLAYSREREQCMEAAFKYLILSAAASAFLLFGLALIYLQAGSLLLGDMLQAALHSEGHLLFLLAMAMVLTGVGYKLSLVPFHWWTPDVYEGAPLSAGLMLATLSKVAVFAILMKMVMALGNNLSNEIYQLLAILAITSMVLGNVLALKQDNLKRILAFSAVAHMGYVLVAAIVALKLDNQLILQGAIYYLFAYILASITLFAILTSMSGLEQKQDCETLDAIEGLFWRAPWLATGMILALLSLAGMPITIGFVAKFYVLNIAVESQAWWLVTAMIVGSGIAIFYYLRWIFTLLKPSNIREKARISPLNFVWLFGVGSMLLVIGVLPGLVGNILNQVLGG
ncbi:MAG: NADH-quinone oxidoreductase subunit N [Aestuariibacter sp.]